MKKKIVSLLLIAVMVLGLGTTAFAANVKGFSDVKDTDWFAPYVEYAVEHELFAGTSSNTFSPAGNMTRAMFVTVLGRMNGVSASDIKNNNKFTDVQFDSYYGPYVVWANENNIVNGTSSTTFSPNSPVTREQAATLLYRYMQKMGVEATAENPAAPFLDMDKANDYAKEAINAMRLSGFIAGSNGYYMPKDYLTRAQCATILARFNNYLETGSTVFTTPKDNDGNGNGNGTGEGPVIGPGGNGGQQEIAIERIAFAANSLTMTKDSEASLFINYYPSNTTMLKYVDFTCSDTNIIDIGMDGIAYAANVGTATITATTENGKTATCTITVQEKSVPATSVSFNKTSVTLEVGETENLIATVSPANTTDNVYSIETSDYTVVDVNGGVIVAKKAGTATITVTTTNGKTATCRVTVTPKTAAVVNDNGVSLNKNTANLKVGGFENLIATVTPENAENKTVTWTSSNNAVATVNNGSVQAVKAGTATITVKTQHGFTATCTVTVTEIEPVGITLNQAAFNLNEGEKATVIAYVAPRNVSNNAVTFTSSNSTVASVNNDGVITAVKAGTATITAKTVNGKTASCTVNVASGKIEVQSLTMNQNTLKTRVGRTVTLYATASPANAENTALTWTSSDATIASVQSGGIVTGIKEGTATITATASNGVSASCVVIVEKEATNPPVPPVDPDPTNNATFKLNYDKIVIETADLSGHGFIGWADGDVVTNAAETLYTLKITSSNSGYTGGILPMLYTVQSTDESVVKVDSLGNVSCQTFISENGTDKTASIVVTSLEDNSKYVLPVTVTRTDDLYKIDDDYIAAFAAETLRLTNIEREKAGKSTLGYRYDLQSQIDYRTTDLAVVFSHTMSDESLRPEGLKNGGENCARVDITDYDNSGYTNTSPEQVAYALFYAAFNDAAHRVTTLLTPWNGTVTSVYVHDGTAYSSQVFKQ